MKTVPAKFETGYIGLTIEMQGVVNFNRTLYLDQSVNPGLLFLHRCNLCHLPTASDTPYHTHTIESR